MAIFVNVKKKRVAVNPKPNAILSELLADVLSKAAVPPAQRSAYILTMNGRRLDLSMTAKQAAVRAGSTLEAEHGRGDSSKVRVALQAKGKERIACEVGGGTTLWDVLRESEVALGVNLSTAEEPFMQPVVQFMRRELRTVAELKETTVASLGAGGGLLRVSFHPTSMTLALAEAAAAAAQGQEEDRLQKLREEKQEKMARERAVAHEKREQELRVAGAARAEKEEKQRKERENEPKAAVETKESGHSRSQVDIAGGDDGFQVEDASSVATTVLAVPKERNETKAEQEELSEATQTAKKRLVWASTPPATVPQKASEWAPPPRDVRIDSISGTFGSKLDAAEPDGTHELTTHDLHALQEISAKKKELRVRKTAAQAKKATIELYPSVRVQVRFPHGILFSASFHLTEKVHSIASLVKEYLRTECPSFQLVAAPRRILDEKASLYDEQMYPAVALKLQWNSTPPEHVLTHQGEAILLLPPASQGREEARTPSSSVLDHDGSSSQVGERAVGGEERATAAGERAQAAPASGKVPKWLKLGK